MFKCAKLLQATALIKSNDEKIKKAQEKEPEAAKEYAIHQFFYQLIEDGYSQTANNNQNIPEELEVEPEESTLSAFQQFLITCMRLRLNVSVQHPDYCFGISTSTASRVLLNTVSVTHASHFIDLKARAETYSSYLSLITP